MAGRETGMWVVQQTELVALAERGKGEGELCMVQKYILV
jgi:hypothetical protein